MGLVIAGWIAAALVFSTFITTTMLRLRLAAIAGNLAFITYALLGLPYGQFGRLYPILVLHACLLPLNVARLAQLRQAAAAARDTGGQQVTRALAPYLSCHQPRPSACPGRLLPARHATRQHTSNPHVRKSQAYYCRQRVNPYVP